MNYTVGKYWNYEPFTDVHSFNTTDFRLLWELSVRAHYSRTYLGLSTNIWRMMFCVYNVLYYVLVGQCRAMYISHTKRYPHPSLGIPFVLAYPVFQHRAQWSRVTDGQVLNFLRADNRIYDNRGAINVYSNAVCVNHRV